MFSLAYLIVTHNGEDSIEALIQSISFKSGILVIDNASTDKTVEILRKLKIRVVQNTTNIGYGAAINQGMAELSQSYTHVLVLNQDVVIQEIVQEFEKYREYAVIQPVILLPNGNINVDELRMNVFGYVYPPRFNKSYVPPNPKEASRELFFFSGSSFVLNVEKYKKIGPFDESLFLYYEDVDYAFKMFLKGEKAVLYPSMVVAHHYKNSLESKKKIDLLSRNREVIVNRYMTDRWRKLIYVKKTENSSHALSGEERNKVAEHLKKQLLLGFYTKQFPFWKRFFINFLLVPYSWAARLFI